ncbi:hypothetical protein FACS189461_4770 [Spirochaetia bacterium]|nr:hypothetical protein FACS189461_4770 [Spirochaetia bacterium]
MKNILPAYIVKNYHKILHTPQGKWELDNGPDILRFEYPELNKESIVFDIGGYTGQWTSDLFSKYCCTIYLFEPVKEFANKNAKRFYKNDKITCCPFGLSDKTQSAEISVAGIGSSIYHNNGKKESVELKSIIEYLHERDIEKIDLMKINIEGGEYALLECLIEHDFIKKIENLQIQFHSFIKDAVMRRNKIQDQLTKTHKITYQYEFTWENWKRIQV